MDDNEMLERCSEAWQDSIMTGRPCRVYTRYVGNCADCSFSIVRRLKQRKEPVIAALLESEAIESGTGGGD